MIEERIAALEARMRAAEDELEIQRLVARYGPAVDGCLAVEAAGVFTEDGAYDPGGGFPPVAGRAAMHAFYENPRQNAIIAKGAAHITLPPEVTLQGDEAVGVGYSLFFLKGESGWNVMRASANAWKFRRTAQGWRIVERTNRLLDGSEEARVLLRHGLQR
jgi:hypothetical protein